MAAFQRSPVARSPRRREKGRLFCVGWKAFVHWPARAREAIGHVPLIDASGRSLVNDLADGEHVEILSWRPRAGDGSLYQIRRLADGSEGWIGGQHLRRQAVPEAADDLPGESE